VCSDFSRPAQTDVAQVIFCSSAPLSFRAPVRDDFLRSSTRMRALSHLEDREIAVDAASLRTDPKLVLTDRTARRLTEYQAESVCASAGFSRAEDSVDSRRAMHWQVMRETLSEAQWAAY
jgi:hypothetical protein